MAALGTAPSSQHPELGARARAPFSHVPHRHRSPARHMERPIYFHQLLPQVFGAKFTLLTVHPYVQEEKARQ